MSSNWERVISSSRLITLPAAYLELKQVLNQPDFSMADVAVPISKDPALTARLLRLVNSAFYGLSGQVDTVFRAVTMIGTEQLHDLALATAVTHTFDGIDNEVIDMHSFWRHSVYCGLAAKNLAIACDYKDSERMFVAGLLHDIGHLIMYQSIPELCQQCIIRAFKSGQSLHVIERELIGFDYARVGGTLMQQWNLPRTICESTEFHLEPDLALISPREAFITHIAKAILSDNFNSNDLYDNSLEVTGLSEEQIMDVRKQTEEELIEVFNSLFPLKKAG